GGAVRVPDGPQPGEPAMAVTTRQPAPASLPRSKPRRRGRWWSRIHFGIRFLGLLGALCAAVGAVLARARLHASNSWEDALRLGENLVQGTDLPADQAVLVGLYLLAGGLVAATLALLVEAVLVLAFVAGRRSALGFSAVVQIVLAVAFVAGL